MSAHRYLVTARKYRPKLFSELVAQEHVTETLENALRLDRLAHAYLFSGPRGVGKTTAARILAKAINCLAPLDEREGAEPCRTCESCRTFEEGRSLNIIEIDAASNNKVDDIRELRESVRVPPQGSRRKVYIIDEVHMLSTSAFNALLKTLEEPPPHVLFIFATTEPNKVLPTILSRCQRFDFRRIPVPAIVEHLRAICRTEEVEADDASLLLLARKGDGALRDALSAFDQAVALCGTELRYADLARALGVVEVDRYFEVTDAVHAGDSAALLRGVERVVRAGHDLQEFLVGLAEHLRNVLVARTMQDAALVEATEAVRARYLEAAAAFGEGDLLRLLTVVDEAQDAVRTSSQPRLKLELALLKMGGLARAADLRAVMRQLDRLERLAEEGRLPAAPPAASDDDAAAPPATRDDREAAGDGAAHTYPSAGAAGAVHEPAPPTPEPEADAPEADTSEPARAAEPEATEPDADDVPEPPRGDDDPDGGMPEPAPAPEPSAPSPAASDDDGAPRRSAYADLFGKPALKRRPRPDDDASHRSAHTPSGDGAVTTAAPPPAEDATPSDDARRVREAWPSCVQAVTARSRPVGSCLRDTRVTGARGGRLTLEVPSNFHRHQLLGEQELLREALHETAGVDVTFVDVTVGDRPAAEGDTRSRSDANPKDILQTARRESPALDALCEQFGVEIVWT